MRRARLKTFLMRFLGRAAAIGGSALLVFVLAKVMAVPVHAGPADGNPANTSAVDAVKSHTREAAHDIASGTKDAAHQIAAGTREAAHQLAASTRETRHEIAGGARRVKVTLQREAHAAASAVKREAQQLRTSHSSSSSSS